LCNVLILGTLPCERSLRQVESLKSGSEAKVRSDDWSLGVVASIALISELWCS